MGFDAGCGPDVRAVRGGVGFGFEGVTDGEIDSAGGNCYNGDDPMIF